jgi:hypothetical protein
MLLVSNSVQNLPRRNSQVKKWKKKTNMARTRTEDERTMMANKNIRIEITRKNKKKDDQNNAGYNECNKI